MSSDSLWEQLENTLKDKITIFDGVAGLAVKSLTSEKSISINGDEVFPTASTIKVHVLAKLFSLQEEGKIDLSRRIRFTQDMYGAGSGVIHFLENDPEFTFRDVAILMMLASDNTATNICIDIAGMEGINDLIRDMGLSKTRLRRKMMDPEAITRGDENVSTPNDLILMMAQLHNGKPNPKVSAQVLQIMSKPKSDYLNKAVGSEVVVANKPGAMGRAQGDTGIVFLPNNPYTVSIMSKFSMVDSIAQEGFIIDLARTIHKFMAIMEETNEFGLSLPKTLPL
ncbi:MAG: beta-lactamase class A [Chloroflexi bacterium]|jgi:beta-lactamase class A|nr:MAG: beta-lactamase class A [Chloroflexota bacterium]